MAYETIRIRTEAARCLLCHDAPCSRACTGGLPVSDILRSLRFENRSGAAGKLKDGARRGDGSDARCGGGDDAASAGFAGAASGSPCTGCDAPCMKACNRGKIDGPVRIPEVFSCVCRENPADAETNPPVDLSVDFCGLHCENPFFLSSSVVGSNAEMIAKAFDLGWAGVAFKTVGLFTPLEVSPRFAALEDENRSWIGFKNIEQISDYPLEENIGFIRKLKAAYPKKIITASIMGRDEEEWTRLAKLLEGAGADMIECNFSCPHMAQEGVGSDVGENPELVGRYVRAVKKGTRLPVLAKMTPNVANMEIPALAAVRAGADGLAAVNTVKSLMNVDLDHFSSAPDVDGKSAVGGYSGKAVKPIALRFIHDLKSKKELCDVPVSGMGGIETWRDAVEFIAMGCGTVQVTTAVMGYGYRIIEDLAGGLRDYLASSGKASLKELMGAALAKVVSAEELNRHTVEYPRFHRQLCVGCGRCYISCFDGGHQALSMKEGKPVMDAARCVGCQLCRLVCPAGAISAGTRAEKRKTEGK